MGPAVAPMPTACASTPTMPTRCWAIWLPVRAARWTRSRVGVETRTASMAVLIGVGLVLGLAVLIPLTYFSVRSIAQSLGDASRLAERIAAGDLTEDVHTQQQDEVGQLVSAMARMQESLRDLVRQVQEAAGNISTANSEIANGNRDLSHRTEQTAANLGRNLVLHGDTHQHRAAQR